jgi:lipoprotein-anchoring transpeptidase ErfK/SrfK
MANPTPRRRRPGTGPWTRYADRFGWRAYAVVLLAAVTVIVVLRTSETAVVAAPIVRHTQLATSPTVPVPASTRVLALPGDAVPCASNTASQAVFVSISAQQAWMCQGSSQVLTTPVTTGDVADNDATPTGSWHVQDRQTNRYLTGPGYSDYVKFWVPFNGDFGFHDASWQTFPFGSDLYKTDGSHGCVHLPTPTMQWFYGWITVGALVTIAA